MEICVGLMQFYSHLAHGDTPGSCNVTALKQVLSNNNIDTNNIDITFWPTHQKTLLISN